MPIFGFKAHIEPINLYKIGNLLKYFNSNVCKFLVLLLIVK
jgi:hypothetical protein